MVAKKTIAKKSKTTVKTPKGNAPRTSRAKKKTALRK